MTAPGPPAAEWTLISALMDEALALPAAERAAWVDRLAGARAAHKESLRRLLAAHAQSALDDLMTTLPRLAAMPPAASMAEPQPGEDIGPYRLLHELGAGGMGTVWLAERADGGFQRRVALKLPRLAWGSATGERLNRERDILATLEHPHIARLYDAGIDHLGRPYLAMEYVEGRTIDHYCREQALPLPQRIGLLLQVAAAVGHAHARLVVHRDLKPANILVGSDGQVRLLDFGIAKLLEGERTEETALTQRAGHMLTPDYASPEQIRGEPLSTASDVYSLGVLAYELLSGERPYRLARASAAALQQAIAETHPAQASSVAGDAALKQQLRGDLDAILNMALKKDPAERYPSVDAFAQDLRRHLAREPVLAQPDRLSYRAGRFISRHRVQVSAAAAVVVALIGGAGVAAWQAHEARLQAARANAEALRASAEAQRANEEARRATAEAATATAVQGFIEAVFRANSGDQADPQAARDATARQLLDSGARRIGNDLQSQPAARLRIMKILASMYEDMGVLDQAAALQQQRLALARSSFGVHSREAAAALIDHGYALTNLEQRDDALAALAEAGRLLDALGERQSATRFELDIALASLYRRLDPAKGLEAGTRAVAFARTQPVSADLVRALQGQGENAYYTGQPVLARSALEEAIRHAEARPEAGGSMLTAIYSALADVLYQADELEAAEQRYRQALARARAYEGADAYMVHFNEFKLADFLHRVGRFAEGPAVIRPAADWARRAKASHAPMASTILTALGRALVSHGRVEEGLRVYTEVERLLPDLHKLPDLQGPLLAFRAEAKVALGRHAEAEALLARAQAIIEGAGTGQLRLLVLPRRALLLATGRAEQALAEFQADRIQRQLPPLPADGEPAPRLAEAARLHLALGQAAPARGYAEQALAALARDPQRRHRPLAEAQATAVLGQALLREGQAGAALPPLVRAAELHRALFDPAWSLQLAEVLKDLAAAQQATGDDAAAQRTRAAMRAIQAKHRVNAAQH
ncbi:serine/threonine-protein kinase [Aquabacterium sp.]|uniref:serine/threonine-protein kinase n=1 Tax=Aquabacterium sp. TaxID=1872578 RepID=UPI002CB7730E|nr:serine/threonine-protein kinase [Aquabacterium sp.]HSW04801.1 serine/threonine-protein kinase [Aquabacterium sp.]